MENNKEIKELEDKELEIVNGGGVHCQYRKGLGCSLSLNNRTFNECKNCSFNGNLAMNL